MQTLAVVNTGALNFVKLETEDMDQVPIHKDGGLHGIRNGRSAVVSVLGRTFYVVYNCQNYFFNAFRVICFIIFGLGVDYCMRYLNANICTPSLSPMNQ